LWGRRHCALGKKYIILNRERKATEIAEGWGGWHWICILMEIGNNEGEERLIGLNEKVCGEEANVCTIV
jgi:hypothetical protein